MVCKHLADQPDPGVPALPSQRLAGALAGQLRIKLPL
jgi:hypothetical protein